MAPETTAAKDSKKIVGLPILVTSQVDVGRLLRELEQINDVLLQANLSKTDQAPVFTKNSLLMDQLLQLNKLDVHDKSDRLLLEHFLVRVKQKSPVLHVSFSADPNTAFIEKLMTWLRREIHPLVLLTVGLQPNIGAGCVVRSTNKYFDLSLRKDFESKHQLLVDALGSPKLASAKPPNDTPAAGSTPQGQPA